jgi:membrane protease YdiL (CAAX protease family)
LAALEQPAPGRVLVAAGAAAAAPTGVTHFGLPQLPPQQAPLSPGAPDQDVTPTSGPMLSGRAVALVVTAIGIGAVGMCVSWLLGRDGRLEPATYIRYALVLTLGVYVVVGALIVVRLVPGVALRWHTGRPATSILLGAGIGGAMSALLLAGVSSAAGHLSPDPRIVTLMSEGDLAHIVVTIGITCLCAPLLEEVLFRGLLLESLRSKGRRAALWLSGIAFAVWHLNPAALRYYALMGLMLGGLYLRRGLVCSIAAHVAFNGVLTVAALAVVLAPARTVTVGDLSFSAPSGWGQVHTEPGGGWTLTGPSDAELFLAEQPVAATPTADQMRDRLREGLATAPIPGVTFDSSTLRETTVPAGVAVEMGVTYEGHGGTFAMLAVPGELVELVFMDGGSPKAQADFPRMLQSLRVG